MFDETTDPGALSVRLTNLEDGADDHEHRIRTLEHGAWRTSGFAAIASGLGAALAAWLTIASYLHGSLGR